MRKRIPTILGIVLIIVLVVTLAFVTSQVQKVAKIFSQAEQSVVPLEVGVGNVSDNGFAVYWTTEKETTGAVNYGRTEKLEGGLALDERQGQFTTHLVRITGLAPETKHFFQISSTTDLLEVTTLPKSSASTGEPIFGKVLDRSGNALEGVIAVWEAGDNGKIVGMSKSDGTYLLPTTTASSQYTEETINLNGGPEGTATINCQPGLDRPLPTVKLGENIDCRQQTNGKTAPGSFESGRQLQTNISEGETVNSPLPTFFGTAGPNQVVRIEVNSETPYSGTVVANPDGSWSWTPPANLSPGQHTVTITVQNADGTIQTITRTFYVAAGEQILPITSGTPSATPVPTEIPTPLPTEIPTPLPTPVIIYPPVTGRTETTLFLLTFGIISATLGARLFLKNG